jgi:hypothetical protein
MMRIWTASRFLLAASRRASARSVIAVMTLTNSEIARFWRPTRNPRHCLGICRHLDFVVRVPEWFWEFLPDADDARFTFDTESPILIGEEPEPRR